MSRISGIIRLKCKEGIDFGKVQETINNIYLENKDFIDGMEYNQFDKEETLIELNNKIKEWCK